MDPKPGDRPDLKNAPAVWYAGYSIHGNEASGTNASMLFAYYLAAAQNPETEEFLRNTVVLLDPCFNPDGMQRFSTWVNSRQSKNGSTDPAADEFREPWPQGRTNHYWFDLNRDWLVMQQPESAGRVALLQAWKPNVLTDHHEMGSNSTFFFQPGVPSRVNPNTPARNQELTAKIAAYHARLLSEHNILFYTRENYDDFYYGKGSTYPDANGGVGILFEQASSRGSAQETDNGLLTFPFTIRNQVLTSLSTMKAVGEMRLELNEYLRDFYTGVREEAKREPVKDYVFGSPGGFENLAPLIEMLDRHRIRWYGLAKDIRINETDFKANAAAIVPLDQPQFCLIKGMFSSPVSFTDSIFYDISAWTLPYAMGLDFEAVEGQPLAAAFLGTPGFYALGPAAYVDLNRPNGPYAYVVEWNHPESPRALAALQRNGLQVKVAMHPFSANGKTFQPGTLVIPVGMQTGDDAGIRQKIQAALPSGVFSYEITNGLTPDGPDLGSTSFPTLRSLKAAMLTGDGISASDAGEIWYVFDSRYHVPLTMIDQNRFGSFSLSGYSTLILPDGNYNLPAEKVREFVSGGGTVIATGAALHWLKNAGLMAIEFKNAPTEGGSQRPYEAYENDLGARKMPGAIFEAELDLTHPLCFGYSRSKLPVFLNDNLFIERSKNSYASPVVFTANPLLAGYIHSKQKPLVARSAGVTCGGIGKGRIVCFTCDPVFRSFWFGTSRLLANAVFFGNLISGETVERKE
jgi:hypothetical protein